MVFPYFNHRRLRNEEATSELAAFNADVMVVVALRIIATKGDIGDAATWLYQCARLAFATMAGCGADSQSDRGR